MKMINTPRNGRITIYEWLESIELHGNHIVSKVVRELLRNAELRESRMRKAVEKLDNLESGNGDKMALNEMLGYYSHCVDDELEEIRKLLTVKIE